MLLLSQESCFWVEACAWQGVGQLQAAHALSGYDTVAHLWGIGKNRVVKVLKGRSSVVRTWE